MTSGYAGEDLLDFLGHAGDRGLLPAATASALAVASRRMLEILSQDERADVRKLDPAAVIKRFGKKRGKDFNPNSLKEYGRRFQRAIEMFKQWREHPAAFSARTRSTSSARKTAKFTPGAPPLDATAIAESHGAVPVTGHSKTGFHSAFPVRPGTVVTVLNVPTDLTKAEAERLAQFVRMLASEA